MPRCFIGHITWVCTAFPGPSPLLVMLATTRLAVPGGVPRSELSRHQTASWRSRSAQATHPDSAPPPQLDSLQSIAADSFLRLPKPVKRTGQPSHRAARGTIPARAGETFHACATGLRSGDHPRARQVRSRGVCRTAGQVRQSGASAEAPARVPGIAALIPVPGTEEYSSCCVFLFNSL